jgi:hypothetical protein
MNDVVKKIGTEILDVIIREVTEQFGKWVIEQSKTYIRNTTEKGRMANKSMNTDQKQRGENSVAE